MSEPLLTLAEIAQLLVEAADRPDGEDAPTAPKPHTRQTPASPTPKAKRRKALPEALASPVPEARAAPSRFLSAAAVVRELGVSLRTAYDVMNKAGAQPIGRLRKVSRENLDAWLASERERVQAPPMPLTRPPTGLRPEDETPARSRRAGEPLIRPTYPRVRRAPEALIQPSTRRVRPPAGGNAK